MLTTTQSVWDAFHVPLQQFIRRRVSDEATAEDVLQDVFLKIHQHMETLKDVKKLEGWIYQITRNAIIDFYRSSRPTTTLEAEEVLDMPSDGEKLARNGSTSIGAYRISRTHTKGDGRAPGFVLFGCEITGATSTGETQTAIAGVLPF